MRSAVIAAFCLTLPLASWAGEEPGLQAGSANGAVQIEWKPDAANWIGLGENKGLAVLRPSVQTVGKTPLPLNLASGAFSIEHPGLRREEAQVSVQGAGRIGLQVSSAVYLSSESDSALSLVVAKPVLIPGKTVSFPVNLMVPKGRFDRGSLRWSVTTSFEDPVELSLPYLVVPTADTAKAVDVTAIRPKPFSITSPGMQRLTLKPSVKAGPWLGFGGLQMARIGKDAMPASPDGFWAFASKSENEVAVMTQVAGLPAGAMIRMVLLTKIDVRAELTDMHGRRMPLVAVTGEQLQSWTERWFVVPPDPLFSETKARGLWLWFDGLTPEAKTGLIEIRVPKT